jgi:hypothetical protein
MRECAISHSFKGHGSKFFFTAKFFSLGNQKIMNDRLSFLLHFQLLSSSLYYIYIYNALCWHCLPRQGYCVWIHYRVE